MCCLDHGENATIITTLSSTDIGTNVPSEQDNWRHTENGQSKPDIIGRSYTYFFEEGDSVLRACLISSLTISLEGGAI